MKKIKKKPNNKNARGSAAQFFVAGEIFPQDLLEHTDDNLLEN